MIVTILLSLLGVSTTVSIAFVRSYFQLNVRITENTTNIAAIQKELKEHIVSNINSFDAVAKIFNEYTKLNTQVAINSENMINIERQIKFQTELTNKQFESILLSIKEQREVDKEEHGNLYKVITKNHLELTKQITAHEAKQ